jgi:hypothetical protein
MMYEQHLCANHALCGRAPLELGCVHHCRTFPPPLMFLPCTLTVTGASCARCFLLSRAHAPSMWRLRTHHCVCVFGRYNAPFPFGLRHADGSPMTKAETVRRLVKLQVPMFAIPRSRITALGTSQAVGSGARKQAHSRCMPPPHPHSQALIRMHFFRRA